MTQILNEEMELVEDLSTFGSHQAEPFYQSGEFWVGVAFVLVVAALFKPVGRIVQNTLLRRREQIASQIDEAQKLRDDAQVLLADYEKKFIHAENEVDAILHNAEAEISREKKNVMKALQVELKKSQNEAEKNMSLALEHAQNEIYATVSKKAFATAKQYALNSMDPEKHTQLIDSSIENILNQIAK